MDNEMAALEAQTTNKEEIEENTSEVTDFHSFLANSFEYKLMNEMVEDGIYDIY